MRVRSRVGKGVCLFVNASLPAFAAICDIEVLADPSIAAETVPVTVENFVRAETNMYFGGIVKNGGFEKLDNSHELTPIDRQTVIRMNRDTLYSSAVVDLDAGLVTITLPDAGKRFRSMQIINEDEYTPVVVYDAGGCDGKKTNCQPIMPGWNYIVRLYRPHAEILNGTWKFPDAQPVK
jgi:hypothetical protein